ncbi:SDR family oxidoreductase [Nocardiopsis sp. NPDC006139]|uniref:SDR family NAD(P)-dependent oxidoreductase n=1 Tax=Nocardiopsis sp. NPDC006139 TaxID=3154578 RepID=UPI0033AFB619
MGQLDGRTSLVTGGNGGIGLATAQRLADEGSHVFITGRRKVELDAAVEAVGADRATGIVGDVSDPEDLDRLYAAVRARGRGLDVLVANAAIGEFATLEQTTEEHFDTTFAVNARGVVFTVQKALPLLNDGASVVLIGSTAADRGMEAFGAYAASKAAVRSFARTWSVELKGRGIRVNVVSPGMIETPGATALLGEEGARAVRTGAAETVVKGRTGEPEEVAAAVAFLASEQSGYVVGANIYVDGGVNQV